MQTIDDRFLNEKNLTVKQKMVRSQVHHKIFQNFCTDCPDVRVINPPPPPKLSGQIGGGGGVSKAENRKGRNA